MITKYNVGTEDISVYMWKDFLDNDDFRKFADVGTVVNGIYKESQYELFKDENGLYINYKDKKVYLNDYKYDTVDELATKIEDYKSKKDVFPINNDQVLATLMKDTQNIGIIFDLYTYDIITPFGISFTGSKTVPVLCTLADERYKKSDWGYKITLKPAYSEFEHIVAKRDLYFSDFCSLLCSGDVKIVNLHKYKKELEEKQIEKIK